MLRLIKEQRIRLADHVKVNFKTATKRGGGSPKAWKHKMAVHWEWKYNPWKVQQTVREENLKKKLVWLKKSNSYRDIHNDGKCNDKNDVKVSDKGSLGGEGGEEEADEGDAARVGDGQGEQAEK